MMNNIEQELDNLLIREGGYVNDPKDSGGETNYGITKFVAESFGYKGAMIDLTREKAKEIYRSRYWIGPKFDKVYEINPKIAAKIFDCGVNCGTGIAGKFLQRALNVLNQEGKLFPDMTVDGSIGNMTITALKKFVDARKNDGVVVLLRMLNAQQSVRYIEIAEASQKNESFQFGWQLNRIGEL